MLKISQVSKACVISLVNMILITGAAGKTGRTLLRRLSEEGKTVKALVFRPEVIPQIKALGAKEVVFGDMRDREFVLNAMQGVDTVYHICPNVHPEETMIGQIMIYAATTVGISHFVFHSVLHPQIEAMPHHWQKMRVEENLFESGLSFTILQPAAYMQNILSQWDSILKTGRYFVPYSVQSRIAMVDLEDVALVVASILEDGSIHGRQSIHYGATYELVGEPAMPQNEIASILSQHLDCAIKATSKSLEDWRQEARSSGLINYRIDTLVRMFDYYEKFGFVGNTQVLSWLLNRSATNFRTFVERVEKERSAFVTLP